LINMSQAVLFNAVLCILFGLLLCSPVVSSVESKGYFMKEYVAKYGARCLDGSPGLYYWQPATGSGTNKWYVHHMGGGWCESIEDCFGRSKTELGTSKLWKTTMDISSMGGYFSDDANVNPMMYNWNKVFMVYCDGGSFAGNNRTVTNYKNTELYFRGKGILDATIYDLLNFRGLKKATDAVISGCSAGGLATYLHLDYWSSKLDQGTKVVGLPDSGFFMDYEGPPKYHSGMKWVFNQMNCTDGVNSDCIDYYNKNNRDNVFSCYFAQHTAPFIRTPIFPLQSRFDAWQIPNILGSNNVTLVTDFGHYLTEQMFDQLLPYPRAGLWLDSCEHHCGGWPGIKIDGYSMATAFAEFYQSVGNGRRIWFQDEDYPCKSCC